MNTKDFLRLGLLWGEAAALSPRWLRTFRAGLAQHIDFSVTVKEFFHLDEFAGLIPRLMAFGAVPQMTQRWGIDRFACGGRWTFQFQFGMRKVGRGFRWLFQSMAHGRNQILEVVLEDVIRRSAIIHVHHHLLVVRTAYEDEGQTGTCLADNFQCFDAIEGRESVIGKDEVGQVNLQLVSQFGFGLNPRHAERAPQFFQFMGNQLRVELAVFEEKNLNWYFHGPELVC